MGSANGAARDVPSERGGSDAPICKRLHDERSKGPSPTMRNRLNADRDNRHARRRLNPPPQFGNQKDTRWGRGNNEQSSPSWNNALMF